MNNYCCDQMKQIIAESDIEVIIIDEKKSYWMFGHPSFDNDGDGYFDDSTDSHQINYCPFCGKNL